MGDTNGNQPRIDADTARRLRKMMNEDIERIHARLDDLQKWCTHHRESGETASTPWDDMDMICLGCGGSVSV